MSTIAQLSLEEYDRMIAAGVFDSQRHRRLELIHGEIREMAPIGFEHEDAVDLLVEWSFRNCQGTDIRVRVQGSIGLPQRSSAPEPDVAWVRRRSYRHRRPSGDDVLLVIEVAESSLAFDRGEKAELYAAAGVPDYWVVDVEGQRIEVRREPSPDGYRDVQVHSGEMEIRPLALPEAALRPKLLFDEE
jgi:Uma2 family endonuclease